jgi:hypothetical protein
MAPVEVHLDSVVVYVKLSEGQVCPNAQFIEEVKNKCSKKIEKG